MNWNNSWGKPADNTVTITPVSTGQANPWDSLNQDQLLMLHKEKQDLLAAMKQEEMELRKYIVNRAFLKKEEGTNTLELGNGYELKAVVKYNYKLSDNKTVEDGLDKIAAIGNQGKFIADRLVGWTPNFYVSEYREIQKSADEGSAEAKEMLKIIDSFLTIDEAAPTLNIKEPKKKK